MRPRSHFRVDPTNPRAKAVCDRCGQQWQLEELKWQYQWVGPRLQNLRVYVCPPCLDKPQPNIKTIVIPADPIPVFNPRPEQYVSDDNPLSAIGVDANWLTPTYGSRIGSMTVGGGINAAFDGNKIKTSWLSAATPSSVIGSSYQAYVGINWQGNVAQLAMPSSLKPPVLTHSLSSVTVTAPIDRGVLDGIATTFQIQSSPTDTPVFSAWTTLATGSLTGAAGQSVGVTISATAANSLSQFHRVAFLGNGVTYLSVAQVTFSVNEVSSQQ
jgi:hypothetical protein